MSVKADNTNITYTYGSYSTKINYYENLNKIIVTTPEGTKNNFEITKSYFLAYWQGQYFVFLESDSPISFQTYSTGYQAVSDSNIYASLVRWNYGSGIQDSYSNILYEVGTYKTGSEDMLLGSLKLATWGQIISNHDVYVVTNDSSTLYLEKNLSITNTEKFSIGYHTFPSIIDDGNDSFIIFNNSAGTTNFGFGTWLITYNKSNIAYLGLQNTGSSSYPYELMLFTSPTGGVYDSISYKAYKLENNEWVLTYDRTDNTTGGNKYIVGVNNIYYSTENVYMYKYSSTKTLTFSYDEYNSAYKKSSDVPNLIETKTYTIEDSSTYTGYENIIYETYELEKEYLLYEYDLVNNSYYNIRFYTDNFNSNYKYQIKFDYNNSWVNINDYLSSGSYSYTLTKNSTLYMQVLNENGESIETKTMTFSDITYNEENYTPSVEIDVSYSIGINNLAKANVIFNIKNYSPIYYYKYSFNDIEDININTSDIVNNQYSFETYQNGTVYFYVYNQEGEVVYKTSKIIDSVLDNEIYYYYEFDMSKFYNESDNSINTLVFYYEEGETLINDKKVLPYINMYLLGEDNKLLPFYITYSTDVIDVNTFSRNVNFDKSISQYLPYEKLFESKISYHYKSYTAYAVAPIMDLTNNTFEDYDNYKLVIRTTKKMSDNYFSFIGGVMLPQPNINTDLENYNTSKSIFDMFINPIKEKFPIFWQLPDIFNSLNFDKGDGTLPPVLIDFSFLGIDKQLNVIDFSYFVEYRPYLFGILKIILGFYTLRNVNKNLNLGGGN